ncbi:MAG: ATP-binding protein, partial [Ignavibacteriales bacterium]|nr:ATP-binding protein [Ignavibacteriales bacterium]
EQVDEGELKANAELLRSKLADFGVAIDSVSVTPGPVVTLYELVPATGVKISRIESLEDDIALAMKAKGIRIIAPIPGKGTVGVEIPNHHPSLVTIRSVINSSKFRDSRGALPLALGKTITGEVYVDDLTRMPHLLIAGATGSGKSVGINTILCSLIFRLHPSDVKFVIIDPKKIELSHFRQLKYHYLAVSSDIQEDIVTTPANAVLLLKSVELEMEKRYDRLAAAGVRNIADYNEKVKSGRLHDTEAIHHRKLPYLIVVIDELADLMITAAREVEEPIARLAQLARAVGVHLVLATQRPSVDVITGVIKANFPARIAYQVATKIDSRTILDMNGAEQLLGNGDMLYFPPGSPKPIRIQNAFISTMEVEGITTHIGRQKGYSQPMQLPSAFEKKKIAGSAGEGSRDELFEEAARIIVRHQQGSVSLLQRRLKVGYSRAARLVDELESAGIVGPFDGSKARDVLVESEAELDSILRNFV